MKMEDKIKQNEIYGKLRVVEYSHTNLKRGDKYWVCKCECGNTHTVKTGNLLMGKVKSCGCLKSGQNRKNLAGLRYNRFLVLNFSHTDKWRTSHWSCVCDCGNIKTISQRALVNGSTKSCGCLKQEVDNDRKGVNNPRYNPNLTIEERVGGRFIEGYKEWKCQIKNIFKFKCDTCERSISGKMVSHHLESYDKNPSLRTDLTNGVCLCKMCHASFHKKFGYGNNTKEQYNSFKEWKQRKCLSV